MGTKISRLLESASAASIPVIAGTRDSQLDDPTPCTNFRVRDLLNHLFQVVSAFQTLARREPVDFSTTPDVLTGDWRARYAAETGSLVQAWSDPSSLDGVSSGMGLPQETVGHMALLDLVIHSWDLAVATGQSYEPDPVAIPVLRKFVETMGPTARERGVFKDPYLVPGDDFDLLLASTGRNPVVPGV